ncbi:MAG: NAD(P)/FAD-dependent oxidoreductase [Gemmatimonadota bacterium]
MSFDAVIVGAGPNGLAAAIELARAGLSVHVIEACEEIGGGAKSLELTLPGFVHDPFSAIHPLTAGSPFFSRLPLAEHGLRWVHPPAPLAHPFDQGGAAVLEREIDETARHLGGDGAEYAALVRPIVDEWQELAEDILSPIGFPRSPLALARFGLLAIRSAQSVAEKKLNGGRAAALFAGSAAHSGLALDRPGSAAFGLVLSAAGHAVGWPFPAGGAKRITAAMASYLTSLGGTISTGVPVGDLRELPPARAVLLDLTPAQILKIAGDRLPSRYRSKLGRFRYGAGVFKLDWALDEPIPWRDPACRRAATVHLGGGLTEIVRAMNFAAAGELSDTPFVLLAQHTLFDLSRAPAGKHTAWAYCHVPNGSTADMAARVEAQVERFAPGFRDVVLARSELSPARLNQLNANLVGGDVNGGAPDLGQLLLRPVPRLDPYAIPGGDLYICSASTPPGGGVHGMCGFHAARSALKRSFGMRSPPP